MSLSLRRGERGLRLAPAYPSAVEFLSPPDLAMGLIMALGVMLFFRRASIRKRAEHEHWVATHPHVVGVVDRIRVHETSESSTTYTPVIVFTLPNGQQYAIDGEASNTPEPAVGSEVELAYDAALPSSARIVAPPSWTGELGPGDVVAFLIVGAIAAGASAFVRVLLR